MNGVNINNEFFSGIFREVWKQMSPEGMTRAESDFIMELGELQPGGSCLDLMCGYGRHALELTRRGIRVTAVDNSSQYIEDLSSQAEKEQLRLKAICADIQQLELDEIYECVLCMGNSFAFFDEKETGRLLQKISEWLKPGGYFIMNSWMIAEIAIRHFREKEWHQVGDYKYLLDHRFEFNPTRIESEHIIVSDEGILEKRAGIDYIFTLGELGRLMTRAGLRMHSFYSTPRKRPFRIGDGTIYIVAGKIS